MALEVIAQAKVREGQLEGVKAQAAEIVGLTREQDTHTLRCDWFISADGTECRVEFEDGRVPTTGYIMAKHLEY